MPTNTMGARLSLSSSNPVPSGQNTGATLYYVPYTSSEVTVWNGSAWETLTLAGGESVTLAAGEHGRLFDLFVYKDAFGNLVLEKNWWGGSTRGADLVLHEGILVKNSTTDGKKRRYVGTALSGGSSGSPLFVDGWDGRWLYNFFNKVRREFKSRSPLADWLCPSTATPGTWRCPNNNTGLGTIGIVCGQADVFVHARVMCPAEHPDNASGVYRMQVGIGINSQSARHVTGASYGRSDTGTPATRSLAGLIAEVNEQLVLQR